MNNLSKVPLGEGKEQALFWFYLLSVLHFLMPLGETVIKLTMEMAELRHRTRSVCEAGNLSYSFVSG